MKRHIGRRDSIIGEPRVEHREAVVMLGGEHNVFHAGVPGRNGPHARVKLDRIECLGQRPVVPREPLHVLAALGPCFEVIRPPELVLFDERPGLDAAPQTVGRPVHHESELLVLIPLQAVVKPGGFRVIGRGPERHHDFGQDLFAIFVGMNGVTIEQMRMEL